jgi:cytochrome c biogenesis protein CcmG/thiol:disulfide interchange protein DsbE
MANDRGVEPELSVAGGGDPIEHDGEGPRGFGMAFWLFAVGAVIVIAGLVIYAGSPGDADPLDIVGRRAIAVADPSPAPVVSVPNLEGDATLTAPDPSASATVINFWASWCAPCLEEAPGIQATFERYRSKGVAFLGINERDNRASAMQFVKEMGFTFPSGFDPDGRLAFDFELLGMPTTIVLDGAGQIRYRFTGIVGEPSLRQALDDVLTAG